MATLTDDTVIRSWGCERERSGNVQQQTSYTWRMGERRCLSLVRVSGSGEACRAKKRRVPDLYGGRAGSLGASDEFTTTGACASRKVRVLLPASTAPARDARLFSRQRWICPRERDVDVLHRSSTTLYTRGARWRQAGRRSGVSCQNNCSAKDMLRGSGNMTTTMATAR